MKYLEIDEILELHYWIIEEFGGLHGVRDELALKSLAAAPQTTMFNKERYRSVHEKTAVYVRNCVVDHVFSDGNKRTAVTIAGVFLMRNGWRLTATAKDLENFTVRIITDHLEIEEIAEWLQYHTIEKEDT